MEPYKGYMVWSHAVPNRDGTFAALSSVSQQERILWVSGALGKFEVALDAKITGRLLARRWVDTRM